MENGLTTFNIISLWVLSGVFRVIVMTITFRKHSLKLASSKPKIPNSTCPVLYFR